jgi:ATP-dependent Clp protease ATP-binding subunit ClpA
VSAGRKRNVDARRAVLTAATAEARRRVDRRLGTDHLLLGVLHKEQAEAALGATLESARAASRALDRAALVAVGVDADHLAIAQAPVPARRLLPLSSGARAVVKQTLILARLRATSRVESRDFVLALLTRERPDPAAELLHALGVDTIEARNRLTAASE